MWLLDAGRGLYVAGVVGKSQLRKIQVTEFYFEFTQNHFSHLQHQNPHPRILTRTIDLQPETPDPRHATIIQKLPLRTL